MADHGHRNLGAGSARVTRAHARVEQAESPELSADDSPYNCAFSSKEILEVTFTDSGEPERVEDEVEVGSERIEDTPPVIEPEVRSGSGGSAPMTATVDLRQFFTQMGNTWRDR